MRFQCDVHEQALFVGIPNLDEDHGIMNDTISMDALRSLVVNAL